MKGSKPVRGAVHAEPLGGRVVVRRSEEEEVTPGGIVLPAREKSSRGEVVAVGTGKALESGSIRKMSLAAGDCVLFGKYAGHEFELDGVKLLVMDEDEVFVRFKETGRFDR